MDVEAVLEKRAEVEVIVLWMSWAAEKVVAALLCV